MKLKVHDEKDGEKSMRSPRDLGMNGKSWEEIVRKNRFITHVYTPSGSHCAFMDGGMFGIFSCFEVVGGFIYFKNWAESATVEYIDALYEDKVEKISGKMDG